MNDGGPRLRVLIVGGYGVFGSRLVRLLCDEPRLTLLVAGRSRDKARRLCDGLAGAAERVPSAFDRDGDVAGQFAALAPDVVVDATGPFQLYGAEPYRVVTAALAQGASYMDLADGTGFVAGIAQFDGQAAAKGLFALSGVSTLPVLSSAAVRHLADGLARVETVVAGIAPSPRAGLGPSVVRSFASYAGKRVATWQGGRTAVRYGVIDSRRLVVAAPGAVPLGRIRFTLADAPDLQLMPLQWPGLQSVWTGAGPRPALMHHGLSALSWLVRLRLVPSLVPLAPLFHRAISRLAWGEHRSGMVVAITGRDAAGAAVARSWHVVAEGDDGPLIPSMAVAAVVRRMLAGTPPAPGARPATHELELADYEAQFAAFRIACGSRDDAPPPSDLPLYARVLGAAWAALPDAVRQLHETGGTMVAEGRAVVERAGNPLARLVAGLFSFPKAGDDVPVRVEISERAETEVWSRTFGDRRFTSIQGAGRGGCAGLVVERFGPVSFGLALVLEDDRLRLVPRCWTFLGIPMPHFLIPRGDSYEAVEDGRFRFHVEIGLPLVGLIVRYRGWLVREPE